MKKILYFDKINFDYPDLIFGYKYDGVSYEMSLPFGHIDKEIFDKFDSEFLDYLFFHIGMSLAVHFFNLDDFDEITCPYALDDYAKNFFSNYLQKGLGEFRYTNNLDLQKKIKISSSENARKYQPDINRKMQERILLMCGGGKDSAVAGRLMDSLVVDFSWLIVNPNRHRLELAKKINDNIIMSGKLGFESKINLNRKFRGHKPLSAYLAFIGVLFAYLFDYKYICVGNEQSSNSGNVTVDGFEVNHQYSKSYEFEKNFFDYVRQKMSKDIYYFSPLRPVYDLQLGKIFSHYKDLFNVIISCNDNQKHSSWCAKCAKCAFTFLIMYPFMPDQEVERMFGANLFESKIIRDWIRDMCVGDVRPFECIGTKDECRFALYLCLIKEEGVLENKDYYEELNSYVGELDLISAENKYLKNFENENNIPTSMKKDIFAFFSHHLEK